MDTGHNSHTASSMTGGEQGPYHQVPANVRNHSTPNLDPFLFSMDLSAPSNNSNDDMLFPDPPYSPFAPFVADNALPLQLYEPQEEEEHWQTLYTTHPDNARNSVAIADIPPMDSDGDIIMSPEQITTAAPARPTGLLDLPDDIILYIFALGSSRSRSNNAHSLPTHLEAVYFTCRRLRRLFSSFCQDLTLQVFSNWEYVNTWIEMAAPGLRSVRFREVMLDDDEEMRWRMLPPCFFFAVISHHAPHLQHLDLSGVQLKTVVDGRMLGALLQNVQGTLKSLHVEDSEVEGFLLGALEAGSLQNLTFFEVNWVPAWRKGLRRMLESFMRNSNEVNVQSCDVRSKASALRKVVVGIYVDEVPESNQGQLSNISDGSEFKNWYMPCVEELEVSFLSELGPVQPLPLELILCFEDLRILTLTDVFVSLRSLVKVMTRCNRLHDLRVQDCVLEEKESLPGRIEDQDTPSENFLNFLRLCSNTLTVLASQYITFAASDLEVLNYYHPPLRELRVLLPARSGAVFRKLCFSLKKTLTIVGIHGKRAHEIQAITTRDREDIVQGLTLLSLKAFSTSHLDLSTTNLRTIVFNSRDTLKSLRVLTNFTDCAKNQLRCVLALLNALQLCRHLMIVEINSEIPRKAPSSSIFGQMILTALRNITIRASKVEREDLKDIMSSCIDHGEEGPGSWE